MGGVDLDDLEDNLSESRHMTDEMSKYIKPSFRNVINTSSPILLKLFYILKSHRFQRIASTPSNDVFLLRD